MKIGTDIEHAAARIHAEQLVAMPTETVYGLAADARCANAVAAIFAAKGRPSNNPLIVHVHSLEQAKELVRWNKLANLLAQQFWPGPLTLVLPKQPYAAVAPAISAGLDSVAIRMPAHPAARGLLQACGRPLAAPSANRSGHVTATTAQHVASDFDGQDIYVLDGGAAPIGLESTVLRIDGDSAALLRPGSITKAQLQAVIGPIKHVEHGGEDAEAKAAPGLLSSHYAPRAKLVMNATIFADDDAILAFGPMSHTRNNQFLNLSESSDLDEAASNLFAFLRQLDSVGCHTIAVMPIPQKGAGIAINDRLCRAAAPRPNAIKA